MLRKLIFLLFSSLMTITMSPAFLTAADRVEITGVSDAKAVETVEIVEAQSAPVSEVAIKPTTAAKAPAAGYAPVYTAPANNMVINGRTLEVVGVGSTTVDAGNHVNKYGALLYGHNSQAVFGPLLGMGAGSTFTVTYGGVTTTYRVDRTVMFEKNGELLQLNGAGNFMGATARAVYMGTQYSVAVMTCAGTSYGNGDASHRYVLFANAI